MEIFPDDEARWEYLHFLSEEAGRFGLQFLSWCLTTNHVHFIAIPEDSYSLARAFGEAHRRYTRMRNFKEGVRGYLFQGRFGSCVLDVGFLGGGIASLITVDLIVSIFELKYQSVLPGALFGASIGGLTGFFFPRLGEKLIEFIG